MWRHPWFFGAVLVLFAAVALPAFAEPDREGCKDHPLLTRLPGFYIERCKDEAFALHNFQGKKGRVPVEGHLTHLVYRQPKENRSYTRLEVIRNYVAALEKIGGQLSYQGKFSASVKVPVEGREVWVDIKPGSGWYYDLIIVEKQAMEQQVVADADALLGDLDRVGHAVVRGIFFDTDKAIVKPESKPALEQVATLLKKDPKLKVFVVGHTDMAGNVQHNRELSRQRAAAVVDALVNEHGIARDRLIAEGVGPFAPMGSNADDLGRALNRRVEIVKR